MDDLNVTYYKNDVIYLAQNIGIDEKFLWKTYNTIVMITCLSSTNAFDLLSRISRLNIAKEMITKMGNDSNYLFKIVAMFKI